MMPFNSTIETLSDDDLGIVVGGTGAGARVHPVGRDLPGLGDFQELCGVSAMGETAGNCQNSIWPLPPSVD